VNRAPFVFALVLAAALGACDEKSPPPLLEGPSPVDSADKFLIGMETVLTSAGVLRANVTADTAYLFDNDVRLEMHGVQATFFTSQGVKDGLLTSRRARYDQRADSMEAFGDVKLTSLQGDVLTTPYLKYNKATNKISSDSAFTATGPNHDLTGIGFESDPAMTSITTKHVIRGSGGRIEIPKK